jgi:DNA-binding CsgD family transcriptional regulator
MHMNLKRLLVTVTVLACTGARGQNTIGFPDIINYSKHTYNGGTQNWDIQQDANGIMYMANNEGVLSFNGTYWKIYPLSNHTNVRSIAIGRDNRIYAGGQDEIGYFSPGRNGELVYTSLTGLIAGKDRSFADVWDIIPFGRDIFFRCIGKILHYSNQTITAYPAVSEWAFLGLHHDQLVAQDLTSGLLVFRQGVWMPLIKQGDLPPGFYMSAIIPFGKDSSLITTLKNGVFLLHGNQLTSFTSPGLERISNQNIYGAINLNHNWIALGTSLGGCYIINRQGQLIQSFSRKEGLQNNNITSLFRDKHNNLWLGLDNGIDFIAFDNAIKHIYPETMNEGSGYAAFIYNKALFLGTTNGLYKVPLTESTDLSFVKGQFEPVRYSSGQVWGLSEINGHLLMGHHDGAFQVMNNEVVPVNNRTGVGYWTFLPFNNVYPSSLVLAGTYQGLDIMEYKNNGFYPAGTIPGFTDPARFITFDNNHIIWVSHPYRGVYKINKEDKKTAIKLYANQDGLPSFMNNHVYKVKNRVVVATEKGVYEYDPKADRFAPSGYFDKLLGKMSVRYLKEDASGNVWFIHDKELGVIDLSGAAPQLIYLPELSGKMVSGFEHLYPVNSTNIFLGAEKGFYHINYEQYRNNKYVLKAHISKVTAIANRDSLLFGGYFGEVNELKEQGEKTIPVIAYKWNSLHFEYSSSLYGQNNNIVYSYWLKGFDRTWAEWSKKTEKEYTNLPPGQYTFQVKARNNLGNESLVSNWSFEVLPPWYQTGLAYSIYALSLCTFIYFLYKRQQKKFAGQQQRHDEEQKRLQYLHQLELEQSEKEIIKLRNEKLVTEIDHKNTELASTAMHLVQKGELLAKIKGELMRMKKPAEKEDAGEELKKLLRILHEEDKTDQDWDQFTFHFDKVHSDFLAALKELYPALTSNELKLCAYLRMNLATKQIAQLMNISVRGVEISRYRLRKKLQLSTEVNLFQFLLNIKSQRLS